MKKKFTVGASFTLILVVNLTAQVTIIPLNGAWKYPDNGTNQGAAWRSGNFNDASRETGTGKFGYGISDANPIISIGPYFWSKFVITYFRKTISVPNPAAFALFEAGTTYDVKVNPLPASTILSFRMKKSSIKA